MELVENASVDTVALAALFDKGEDLFLVWAQARYPFDHNRWRNILSRKRGNRSFFVCLGDERIGHAALLRGTDAETCEIGFLFLIAAHRSQGYGREIVHLLERYAAGVLEAKRLTLVVRTYNRCALKCYTKGGFKEIGRAGTLVSISKNVVA